MYVRGPGVPEGVISKLPTTHLDITATILELTGTTDGPATPTNLDGLSFASALKDTAAASKLRDMPELWRDFSFSEFFMNVRPNPQCNCTDPDFFYSLALVALPFRMSHGGTFVPLIVRINSPFITGAKVCLKCSTCLR